jgi:hypothetical protein
MRAALVALLTNEVKRANNMFLKVEGVKNPAAQTDVNPGVQVRIDFDRAVDPATINAASVLISGPGTFSLAYDLSTDNKVLYVQPNPYLSDLQDYTLTITTGIKGALGEELEQPFNWTFKTGTYPAGTVTVTVSQAEVAYTNRLDSELTIKCNLTSYWYRVAYSPTAYGSFSPSDPDGWNNTGGTQFVAPIPPSCAGGDGTKVVYIQFSDVGGSKFSLVRSDSVILDQTPPASPTVTQTISSVATYTNTVYINNAWAAAGATNATASSTDPGGSGVASYKWTPNAGVTITSDTLATPTIQTNAVDGPYSATIVAKDVAGNTSITPTNVSIIRDTAAPAAPIFDSAMTPLYTVNGDPRVTTWYWGPGGGGVGVYRITLYQYQPKDLKWARVYAAAAALTDSVEFASKYLDRAGLKLFSDGDYVLALQEYDVAGNLSLLAPGSCTLKEPGLGQRMILGRAAPTTIDMPVPAARTKVSPKFEWRPMAKAKSYALYYKSEKSPTFTRVRGLAVSTYDIDLVGGLSYQWYVVEENTGESNPDERLGEPLYWSFLTQ